MRTVVSSVALSPSVPVSENSSSHPENDCLIPLKGIDHQSSCPSVSSQVSAVEAEKSMQHETDKGIDDRQDGASESTATANIPTDVHLNIRLPDSSSLQEKFPLAYTLRMIKDYVDRNQSNVMGSYDLAIPYPRKLFGDQGITTCLHYYVFKINVASCFISVYNIASTEFCTSSNWFSEACCTSVLCIVIP